VDPLVLLLLGAVVVSLAVWLIEGSKGVPFETLAIVLIVLLNAASVTSRGKRRSGLWRRSDA
jgi:Ca2+-transporting ATPase